MKQLVVLLAVACVLSTTGSAISGAGETPATDPDRGEAAAMTQADDESRRQIMVYYFHGARRCRTCLTIEANAVELIESQFAKELDSGALVWKVINYDEAENEHFINDFGLVSASLVVVEMKAGEQVRFEVLQKAWSLVRDELGFKQYVHRSILDYLG